MSNAPAGTGASQLMLQRLVVSYNASNGLRGDGPRSTIRAAESVITGNGTGSNLTDGAQFLSYGNNRIDGNTTNGPNPPTISQR